jgi:hypothetical protein
MTSLGVDVCVGLCDTKSHPFVTIGGWMPVYTLVSIPLVCRTKP